MYKVVYNDKYGGFSLSLKAIQWLSANGHGEIKKIADDQLANEEPRYIGLGLRDITRHDPDLVRCVETLGSLANRETSDLKVRELKGKMYRIDEYDGAEEVIEPQDEEYIVIE